jgi:hypothetical protein
MSSLEALSRASSCLVAVVGLAVLLGWHFDIELLRAGLPGHTPVNPTTALALLLAACSLWMHHQARGRPDSAPVRWLAVTAATLIIALGVITLTGYFIGHNLRVDRHVREARRFDEMAKRKKRAECSKLPASLSQRCSASK